MSFEYDRSLVKTVKSLERRTFDPFSKEWVIPVHLYRDAIARFEALGADVELDAGLATLQDEGEISLPQKPEVVISQVGDDYVVQFEYDPDLVTAAKRLPGRTFDPASKAWFIPIQEETRTLRDVLGAFEPHNCTVRLEPKLRPLLEEAPASP